MPLKPRPIPERFKAKLRAAKAGGCVEWGGSISSTGYGGFWMEGHQRLAHRVSWEMSRGPIPAGLQIDHLCRNPKCVNPDHLEPVTPRENVMRSRSVTAANARKTHCCHGHPLIVENLEPGALAKGKRRCKICCRRRSRESDRRHRAQRIAYMAARRASAREQAEVAR